jgi:LL-diaminopimelate aminotransferase
MAWANPSFLDIPETYLFATIGKKIQEERERVPGKTIIRMGIGDVTIPLPKVILDAMHKAVDEMGAVETFQGYPPAAGFDFLRDAIAKHDYRDRGCDVSADEIFVSDGAKSDVANFTDLYGEANVIAISDPVYPVYLDSVRIAGFGPLQVKFMECTEASGFLPALPKEHVDVLYLCSPNNPTGTTLSRDELARWVAYAREHGSLILYDSAYEAYVSTPGVPRSIYEIPGAREVAVEFRSFSKTAGFTGVRCSYTVVPKGLAARTKDGRPVDLHRIWMRRQATKFNGVPYIVQRGAEAVFTEEGQREVKARIAVYMDNARRIRLLFEARGQKAFGGVDAPYVWVKVPDGFDSWSFFDHMLRTYGVAGTPGSGFGPCGEGWIRFTGFGNPADVDRLEGLMKT